MDELFEQIEMLLAKVVFEERVKAVEKELIKTAESIGIEADIKVECKIKSINMDTFNEALEEHEKKKKETGRIKAFTGAERKK